MIILRHFTGYPRINKNSLQGKLRDILENSGKKTQGKLRENSGNFNLIFFHHSPDAAFVYPRLDRYSLSVRMFWYTCGLSRSTLGRLATASSSAGNAS